MAGLLPGDCTSATWTVLGGRNCPVGRSLAAAILRSRICSAVRVADSQLSIGIDDGNEAELVISDAVRDGRALNVEIDVRDKSQLSQAIGGSEVVFLMDIAGASGADFFKMYSVVVQGTKNVIAACRECGVKRLIYNSSADVVFDGVHGIENGDESLPYPHKFGDDLSDLKAQAEALVLLANGKDGLATCALRPCNPFGPRDTHIVKFLIVEAMARRDKYIVGNGRAICDFTHVDNIVHAHILAEEALRSDAASVAGKPFFITNMENMKLLDFMTCILQGLGCQRPKIVLPTRYAFLIAMLIEWVQDKLRLHKNTISCFDPSVIRIFSCTRIFNCSQAKKVIGYSPVVPLEEGIKSTIESFSRFGDLSSFLTERDLSRPSKTETYLGRGEVAEVLLWRNEKKTFSYLLAIFFLFSWFFLSERTFVTSVAKLLVLFNVFLFVHGKLPSSICGFNLGKIPSSHLSVSRSTVRDGVKYLASLWNGGVNILRNLEQVADWSLFLKISGYLLLFGFFSHFSLSTLVAAGIVLLFSFFIIFEQFESEFDSFVAAASPYFISSKDKLMKHLPHPLRVYIDKLL